MDCRLSRVRYAAVVGAGDFVSLRCDAVTLRAIATRLERFGPAGGAPEWLVSAVWLCTGDEQYLATASAEVLGNGHVARPLNLNRPDELVRQVQAELPNLGTRLIGRKGDFDLPVGEELPEPPSSLRDWPRGPYSAHVLVRASQRDLRINCVACALLMEGETGLLLVGTDPSTLAIVLSENPALIERYRADCQAHSVDEYLKLCGG